ncbi:glycoside hydrolase family 32 protein [Exiguobacterium sp. SH1S21]|uniref:glycoside hydrolase family 32 protein n=1 Tax=Exiguobacterium sp. SH1S21 TaxID=2510953 RepID=UPI00103BD0DA|nr:glycoside hydrolase family 32 protein [Exiguobacterium sp. SH1S21]TCI57530.1 glycoside hydrolase family 32 protein [Exiguobacterium sp. SH1S21]
MTFRPHYHFAPPFGWMNDPNGLCQYNGVYHLFYQYHPFGVDWDDMHWGHATSTDLIRWEHKPIALRPGLDYDQDGVFSGSALVKDGVLHLYYTGNVWLDEKRETLRQVQCLATSADGNTFKKHLDNPIISGEPARGNAHVRDPKVWDQEGRYYMVLGTRDATDGKVVLYDSDDAIHWSERGVIAGETGEHGWMWECPDLFHLDGHDVLLLSPQGMEQDGDRYHNLHQCGYFVGHLDLNAPLFTHGTFTELDYGHDFYAAQTFLDERGRRILIAWNAMWERDWPEQAEGWTNQMTIPRELSLRNGRLYMTPIEEMASLRQTSQRLAGPKFEGDAFELSFDTEADFQFACFGETATFSKSGNTLELTRGHEVRRLQASGRTFRIFVDASSIEVFVNDGEFVFSSRVYPSEKRTHQLTGDVTATLHRY